MEAAGKGYAEVFLKGKIRTILLPVSYTHLDVYKRQELVFADFDGVVVVPKEAEEKVFQLAHEKVGAENSTRKELVEGKTLQEVDQKDWAL